MSLYLKYRPQKVEELDLDEVRNRLSRLLASPYIPHAFLFSGPKGTGKTSAARIVAKKLNCEKNPYRKTTSLDKDVNIEPCNTCDSCLAIKDGRHFDVLEIDAASNRGIDEIRELREKIKLAPVSGKYKVYIIDEVHMLTNEAFNALLKTLEEPPVRTVFILATTEVEKLPGTILSRCIKINFNKATTTEILHSLKRVAKGEEVKTTDEVLTCIADFADGSFRDATKFLEQALSEDALDIAKINKILGGVRFDRGQFLKLIIDKNTEKALLFAHDMGEKGADLRFFITDVLNLLHNLLLQKHSIIDVKQNSKLIDEMSDKDITALIKHFSQIYADLKYASKPELLFEVAIIDWCENK